MSQMAARFAAHEGIFQDRNAPAKKRSRFKLCWWSLIGEGGYWPVPCSLDEVFQAIAWAMEVSWPEREEGYTPAGLLKGGGARSVQPWADFIMDGWSVDDPVGAARKAVQRMVLSSTYLSRGIIEWRKRIGISYDPANHALTCKPVIVPKPAYSYDTGPLSVAETRERLCRLLTCAGRGRLRDQHNPSHSKANYPQSVRLSLVRRWEDVSDNERYKATIAREAKNKRWSLAWNFALRYGYPPPDGSVWLEPMVTQRPDETFVDAMLRAEAELIRLTEPDPSRTVDPGAPERRQLALMEQVARMWGAPSNAVQRGVLFFKDDDGDYVMEVGGGLWCARWDRKYGKHGSSFVGSDDALRAVESARTWAPDWRLDVAAGTVRDWDGDVLPVKPGDNYAEPWRGPFGFPGWKGAPPGCEYYWTRRIRQGDGRLVPGVEIRRSNGTYQILDSGQRDVGVATDLLVAGRAADAELANVPRLVLIDSTPEPVSAGHR